MSSARTARPGAGGEGDAVELIGQQRHFEQRLAQRMVGRIAADRGHRLAHAVLKEPLLDELFGVGIDDDLVAELLQLGQAFDQRRATSSIGRPCSGADDLGHRVVDFLRHLQPAAYVAVEYRRCTANRRGDTAA